jgi:hypothetical protein
MLQNVPCKACSYSAVEDISFFSGVLHFFTLLKKKEILNFGTLLNQSNPGLDRLVYDTV